MNIKKAIAYTLSIFVLLFPFWPSFQYVITSYSIHYTKLYDYEIEALRMENTGSVKKALHFAMIRDLDLAPESSGVWKDEDGVVCWRVRIISPEAFSIGLNFSRFHLRNNFV